MGLVAIKHKIQSTTLRLEKSLFWVIIYGSWNDNYYWLDEEIWRD